MIYDEYWFLESGILKVKLLSPLRYTLMLVVWIVTFELVIDSFPSFVYLAVVDLVGIAGIIISTLMRVKSLRRRLAKMAIEDVMKLEFSAMFPWSALNLIEFHGRNVRFRTATKTFKAKVDISRVKSVEDLLRVKMGNRFVVQ